MLFPELHQASAIMIMTAFASSCCFCRGSDISCHTGFWKDLSISKHSETAARPARPLVIFRFLVVAKALALLSSSATVAESLAVKQARSTNFVVALSDAKQALCSCYD